MVLVVVGSVQCWENSDGFLIQCTMGYFCSRETTPTIDVYNNSWSQAKYIYYVSVTAIATITVTKTVKARKTLQTQVLDNLYYLANQHSSLSFFNKVSLIRIKKIKLN